jgi:hypothetical protein
LLFHMTAVQSTDGAREQRDAAEHGPFEAADGQISRDRVADGGHQADQQRCREADMRLQPQDTSSAAPVT